LKYYLYGLYPDSTTIFNISVKMKCKQTNPRFLTNVTTSGDIAHAYFGWFLKWTRKNCFRYLKLMSPLNENTFLKNNYLTSRSHESHYGMRHTTLWSCTHIPNIIDLSGKTKKVMVRTSFAEKKQKKRKRKTKSD
jgi:hypothetical protein